MVDLISEKYDLTREVKMKRLIISLFVCTTVVCATTINVPADYTTIQAGIDASSNGDTVLVQSGTYTGSGNKDLEIGGKSITIISASGATSTLIRSLLTKAAATTRSKAVLPASMQERRYLFGKAIHLLT